MLDFNLPQRSVSLQGAANIPQRQQQSMSASSRHVSGERWMPNLGWLAH